MHNTSSQGADDRTVALAGLSSAELTAVGRDLGLLGGEDPADDPLGPVAGQAAALAAHDGTGTSQDDADDDLDGDEESELDPDEWDDERDGEPRGLERVDGLTSALRPAESSDEDDVIDWDDALPMIREAVREECELQWSYLARRQRERVCQERAQASRLIASASVRKAYAVKCVAYLWNDSDIERVLGVSVSSLRRWRADPEFQADVEKVLAERTLLRAALHRLLENPPPGTTSGTLVDAVKRLRELNRLPVPRHYFRCDQERLDWLESL